MTPLPPPVPDTIRYRARPLRGRSRRRRWFWPVLTVIVATTMAAIPRWTIQRVEVTTQAAVPHAVVRSIHSLVGSPVMLVDLHWVRRLVSAWPGVAATEIRLDPSGVLHIHSRDATVVASLAVGSGWHGILHDGQLGPQLDAPRDIALVGFGTDASALRRALVAVERIRPALPDHLLTVSSPLPDSFRVTARTPSGDGQLTLEIAARPTAAEATWLELGSSGRLPSVLWADLRGEQRLVIRRAPTTAAVTVGGAV